MGTIFRTAVLALCVLTGVGALDKGLRIGSGGRTIHQLKRENESKYEPHTSATFPNRYWFDASNYKPGGPVIILQSGETDASTRLVYLQKGILAQLAQATNGVGVVLEHRYYGTSFPTPDLSTENLRFLTTQQALADEAYFAQNIKFPGMENMDLTSNTTAYISYGGSYSGAFSAFLRVKYPGVFWGSISSSGVTKAIYDYWQYYEPVAQYGPPFAMATQKLFTHMVDNIVIGKNDSSLTAQLKSAFGMPNVTHISDFTNQLAQGVGWWQSLNWDPAVSSPEFYNFCNNISSLGVLYPATESKRASATSLIEAGGYTANETLVNQLLNYIGYINLTAVSTCEYADQDMCFGNLNATFFEQDSLDQSDWRSWDYQVCTEWGYFQTGSGVPANQLPLISRTIDLPYLTFQCKAAYNITTLPDLEEANQYGGYDINYERLAIIDGEWDPWRPATPHAFQYGAKPRASTASEPFILIAQALHHYDENGLFPNQTTPTLPPAPVANTQKMEHQFVEEWMLEWKLHCIIKGGCS